MRCWIHTSPSLSQPGDRGAESNELSLWLHRRRPDYSSSDSVQRRSSQPVAPNAADDSALERDEVSIQLETVARSIGMSGRTLQRRLAEQGLGFEGLCESVRRRRFGQLLRDPSSSLDLIAASLGYADRRSLQRAYRRWTGDGSLARARKRAQTV